MILLSLIVMHMRGINVDKMRCFLSFAEKGSIRTQAVSLNIMVC